eukprot:m.466513 g.466513  ORF g.466513 m.466513 type:complete len:333 (-) comp25280_c0_seq1:181-1179(-)
MAGVLVDFDCDELDFSPVRLGDPPEHIQLGTFHVDLEHVDSWPHRLGLQGIRESSELAVDQKGLRAVGYPHCQQSVEQRLPDEPRQVEKDRRERHQLPRLGALRVVIIPNDVIRVHQNRAFVVVVLVSGEQLRHGAVRELHPAGLVAEAVRQHLDLVPSGIKPRQVLDALLADLRDRFEREDLGRLPRADETVRGECAHVAAHINDHRVLWDLEREPPVGKVFFKHVMKNIFVLGFHCVEMISNVWAHWVSGVDRCLPSRRHQFVQQIRRDDNHSGLHSDSGVVSMTSKCVHHPPARGVHKVHPRSRSFTQLCAVCSAESQRPRKDPGSRES